MFHFVKYRVEINFEVISQQKQPLDRESFHKIRSSEIRQAILIQIAHCKSRIKPEKSHILTGSYVRYNNSNAKIMTLSC